MNINNKKTTLNDEAAIYTHDENVSEKEKWQAMSGKRKWQYFKDYYLGKIVAILMIVLMLRIISCNSVQKKFSRLMMS